jgi:hypothetical protein
MVAANYSASGGPERGPSHHAPGSRSDPSTRRSAPFYSSESSNPSDFSNISSGDFSSTRALLQVGGFFRTIPEYAPLPVGSDDGISPAEMETMEEWLDAAVHPGPNDPSMEDMHSDSLSWMDRISQRATSALPYASRPNREESDYNFDTPYPAGPGWQPGPNADGRRRGRSPSPPPGADRLSEIDSRSARNRTPRPGGFVPGRRAPSPNGASRSNASNATGISSQREASRKVHFRGSDEKNSVAYRHNVLTWRVSYLCETFGFA